MMALLRIFTYIFGFAVSVSVTVGIAILSYAALTFATITNILLLATILYFIGFCSTFLSLFLAIGVIELWRREIKWLVHKRTTSVTSTSSAIFHPPFWRLKACMKFFFPSKVYERVIQPVFADAEVDYLTAVANNEKWKAQWVRCTGYALVWKTVVCFFADSTVGRLIRAMLPRIGG